MARLSWLLVPLLLTIFSLIHLSHSLWDLKTVIKRITKGPEPTPFTPTTDCTKWLKSSGSSIVYNYGSNDTSSGAQAQLDCISRDHAASFRNRVREITIGLTVGHRVEKVSPALNGLIATLPKLETIMYDIVICFFSP
jgi:hypothetical protein